MKPTTQIANPARSWAPPLELDRSRPRDVSLAAHGFLLATVSCLLIIGAVAAGTGLTFVAGRQAEEARLLRQEGFDTDGRIVRVWRTRDKHKRTWATYRYTAGERTYEQSSQVPLSIWRRLSVGTAYPVRYYPGRPELSHLAGLAPRPMPKWLPLPVACALALGGFLTTLPIRNQRRLLAMGRIARARVTEHGKRERTSHGSDLGVRYSYEFHTLSGATARGQAGPSKDAPAPGTFISVLYDPELPAKNAPYPLLLVKVKTY